MEARHAVSAATKVAEATVEDIGIGPFAVMDGDIRRVAISRNVGFYESRVSMRAPDGRWVELPIPETASFDAVVSGQVAATLVEPLGQCISRICRRLRHPADARRPETHARPGHGADQEPGDREVSASDNVLWIKALDDVSGILFALRRQADGNWSSKPMPLPANSTIHIAATADKQDIAFATVEGMLTPTTLMSVDAAEKLARSGAAASSMRRNSRSTSASQRRRMAPAFLFRGAQEGRDQAHRRAGPCLWRLPQRADADLSDRAALSLRPARPVLGRGWRRLRAG
jgi:prolyl oligopeptidase